MTKNIEMWMDDVNFTLGEIGNINTGKFEVAVRKISEQIDGIFGEAISFETGRRLVGETKDIQNVSDLFFTAWSDSSWGVIRILGQDRVMQILERLAYARYVTWSFEDHYFYRHLCDDIKIYRGGAGTKDNVLMGFSWSLSLVEANGFAENHPNGIVLSAEMSKEDVLLVRAGQLEVVPRPNSLHNVVIVTNPNTDSPPRMTILAQIET